MKKFKLIQVWHFIVHLRLHYQFFILSGGYLLSALFVESINWELFGLQFLNVHVLLFGGATAYNSFWDKDEGPIGGLKSPPKMEGWMWVASMLIQFVGLVSAFSLGRVYVMIYGISIFFFWLYSSPITRWKGRPLLSLVAIGVSTGSNSFLLGYLASGAKMIGIVQGFAALGVALIMLSLYPVSQVYQKEEDAQRGDQTFAIRYGLKGIKRLYRIFFASGVLLIAGSLYNTDPSLSLLFLVLSTVTFGVINQILKRLEGNKTEYETVMKIKFLTSFSFVLFILSCVLYKSIISN
tara:strand:+ start:4749 stop:5630 length:882 start_codon:yes stop_codon:yes gene_type:complete